MKIKNLFILFSIFCINIIQAQPLENSLPFENNSISIEKIMAGMVGLAIYFIPTIIARDKIKWKLIFLFNLLTAWTILGWFISFIWAINAKSKPSDEVDETDGDQTI